MLAGILFPLCLGPVLGLAENPLAVAPVVVTWLLAVRFLPRWAVPLAFLVAAIVIVADLGIRGTAVDLAAFDTVILGGSVYAGKLNKNTASFAQEHEDELLTKRLGLFTGGATPPGTKDYVEKLYPAALVRHASAIDILGGLFQADKINFVYKKIIASMRENDKTPGGFHEPTIDPAVIWAFANKMKATTADPTRKRDDHENLG